MPCRLPAVERKPRTLWACHPVAFWISARVAPWLRPIIARIWAPLLSARGLAERADFCVRADLLDLARGAVFRPWAGRFLRLAFSAQESCRARLWRSGAPLRPQCR